MTELWDARDFEGKLLGFDLVRGEEIPKDVFHAVVDVFVLHTDGSVLLMQRAMEKQGYPGCFETGASGSVLKGESPREGAIRELKEETDIVSEELKFLFDLCDQESNSIWYSYLLVAECAHDSIRLQVGETMGYQWLKPADFMDFIKNRDFAPKQLNAWLPYFHDWFVREKG